MKNSADSSALSSIPILLYEKNGVLPWHKAMIDQFCLYGKKHGIHITFFNHWEDILQFHSIHCLIVIGENIEWLRDIILHLCSHPLHIILISGHLHGNYSNISQIQFDQKVFVEYSLNLLKKHGRFRTAFIGPQKNDTSDAIKADTFALSVSPSDIYPISDSLDASFDSFFKNVDLYDSVICTNDLVAVYFMKRCRMCGISIQEQLYLIGNSNLWISSHTVPSLTTCAYDLKSLVLVALQLYQNFCQYPDASAMNIVIKPTMIERASTGNRFQSKNMPQDSFISHKLSENMPDINRYIQYPEIQRIKELDLALTYRSPEDHLILQGLCAGKSYEKIADLALMPLDTVKNRIKKLYRQLNIHTKQELIDFAAEYQIHFAPYES